MEGPSGQQPAPAAALGDALAEALAVLQADSHCQEVSEQEGAVATTVNTLISPYPHILELSNIGVSPCSLSYTSCAY